MVKTTSVPLFQPKSLTLSQQQIELQTSKEKTILVDANAGAAKTTSLALKVAEMLEIQRQKTGRYLPKNILTLTYTDVARRAFMHALEKIGVPADVIEDLCIFTFDEFSIDMLKAIEGKAAKVVMAPEELKKIITQCLDNLRDNNNYHPGRDIWLPSYQDKGFFEHFLNEVLRVKGNGAAKSKMVRRVY